MDQMMKSIHEQCAKEPIRVPGHIQAFGVLLVVAENDFKVTHVSENCLEHWGLSPSDLIGKKAEDIFAAEDFSILQRYLSYLNLDEQAPLTIVPRLGQDRQRRLWHMTAHRLKSRIYLEFEGVFQRKLLGAPVSFHRKVKTSVQRLQKSKSLQELCEIAAQVTRELIGFGRVMIYKFDEEWNGKVIAEDLQEGEDSFFNHHFPASDIPAQAREVFVENWIRMIPDATYAPVPLYPRSDSRSAEPLDLGSSMLRSVSPVHLEYLKNMNVASSLTISLKDEEKLWGLIACHDREPRYIEPEDRLACQLIGQLVSSQIRVKVERQELEHKSTLKAIHAQLLSFMEQEEDLVHGLVKHSPNLLNLASAEGAAAAIYFEGQWSLVGRTPTLPQIEGIVTFLRDAHSDQPLFATETLPKIYPPAKEFKDIACGLLALSIPKSERNYLLWFRPEVVSTVTWAGNPAKAVEGKNGLHPRKSFEAWKEILRERSLPWRQVELEVTQELRNSILALDLRRQFVKEQQARNAAERVSREKDDIVAIVSHDFKNPLGSLKLSLGMLKKALARDHKSEAEDILERARVSIHRMERLIHDLLDIAKIDAGTFDLDLDRQKVEDLVDEIVQIFQPMATAKKVNLIAAPIPDSCTAFCERDRVLQVLSNLVGNALKFTPPGGTVQVAVENCSGEIRFSVSDTGPGISKENLTRIFDRFWQEAGAKKLGTGLGLSIAKGIVDAHGGRIWAESGEGKGARFFFTLPG